MDRLPRSRFFRYSRFQGRPRRGPYNTRAIQRFRAMAKPRRRWYPQGVPRPIEIKSYDLAVIPDAVNQTSGTTEVYLTSVAGIGGTNAFTTGMAVLNAVPQGANFYNRIGSKIICTSVQVRGTLCLQAASGVDRIITRILVVYDRQPNGAFPTYADVLATNDAAPVFDSGINMQNRSRFTVIRDFYFSINQAETTQKSFSFWSRCNLETEFGNSTGLIGDIKTGSILLIAFGNLGYLSSGGGNGPMFTNLASRVRYNDT